MNELAKLRWQCRRGSKELDLLLMAYLDKHYPFANQAEQARFEALLAMEDTDLLKYLLSEKLSLIANDALNN